MQQDKTLRVLTAFLSTVGGLLLAGGIAGVIMVAETGYNGGLIDLGLQFGQALGMSSYLSLGERFELFLVQRRVMLIVLGVIFSSGGTALKWYMRSQAKNDRGAAQAHRPPQPPTGAPRPRAQEPRLLVCEVGAPAEVSYRLGATTRIGRDPTHCEILCPAGTPGVSRLHATITYQDGVVRVTDENSTYGTWLDNERLLPGHPVVMHRGQRLYIGSKQQVYRLT